MEHELPFYREPLSLQLEAMAAAPPGVAHGGRPPAVGPALADARLVDLHPASWFAVAWYPVYRIPDAPLTARFLCFYSLATPLQLLAEAEALPADGPGALSLPEVRLPVVGLKWCDLRGERWLEPLPLPLPLPAAGGGPARRGRGPGARGAGSNAGSSCSGSSGDDEDSGDESEAAADGEGKATAKSTAAAGSAGGGEAVPVATAAAASEAGSAAASSGAGSADCSCSCSRSSSGVAAACGSGAGGGAGTRSGAWSPARRGAEVRARLAELQATAERLARGSWLKVLDSQGPRALKLYHSDFEFFNSRSG
jgi:hypothetical protein